MKGGTHDSTLNQSNQIKLIWLRMVERYMIAKQMKWVQLMGKIKAKMEF